MSTIKRTPSTEAKAKAKAEATIAEAAARASQPRTEAEVLASMLTIVSTGSVAASLAEANAAATILADTEAAAFTAMVAARAAIGAKVYEAYTRAIVGADSNAKAAKAEDVTFTKVAAAAFPAGKNTKAEYEALTPRTRPVRRSWSALAEDFAVYVNCASGAWLAAYEAYRGDAVPTVRDYLTFSRQANANAKANAGDTESAQAKGSRTKRAAEAEAKRQAEAKAKRDADRVAAATKAEADREHAALVTVSHVSQHPAANVVPGVDFTCAALAACTDAKVLTSFADAVIAWRDHVVAEAAAAKAAEPAIAPNTEAEALALGTEAEANAAKAEADAAEYAAFIAWREANAKA